jgi:tRNA(Arg) A34 adenosine deaminase TadA
MTNETPMKLVVDLAKGTQEYIPLTPDEIAQRDQDAAAHAEAEAIRKAEEEAKADAKLAAQAKLQALGLTGEEIAAITE